MFPLPVVTLGVECFGSRAVTVPTFDSPLDVFGNVGTFDAGSSVLLLCGFAVFVGDLVSESMFVLILVEERPVYFALVTVGDRRLSVPAYV